MEAKTYIYEPVEETKLTEDRKKELIESIQEFIKKESIQLAIVVNLAQTDEEANFIYEWLAKNNITIRGMNFTLEKELENYEHINKIGAPGDKTKTYKPNTISEQEQAQLFDELVKLRTKLQNNTAEPDTLNKFIKIRNRLTETSIRLVHWVVGTFNNIRQVDLEYDDKVQVGTMGLLNAVELYNPLLGKFSNYAVVAIIRKIQREEGKNNQISANVMNDIRKLNKIIEKFEERGMTPTVSELSDIMGIAEHKVEIMKNLLDGKNMYLDELYLEEVTENEIDKLSDSAEAVKIGEEYYVDGHLFDTEQDDIVDYEESNNILEAASVNELREKIENLLDTLTYREAQTLRLRFGLIDGHNWTLEEVGQYFNITRERIRQIEAKALRKMRHPSRSRNIRDFIH